MKPLEEIREEVGEDVFRLWKWKALENAQFIQVKHREIYVRGYIEATYLAYGVMEQFKRDLRESRD